MKRITLITTAALAALALSACGPTSAPATAEAPSVEPDTTACIDALDAADELNGYMGDALNSAADSMGYASSGDWDSLDAETAKIGELTPKVTEVRADFDAYSAQCRAAQ